MVYRIYPSVLSRHQIVQNIKNEQTNNQSINRQQICLELNFIVCCLRKRVKARRATPCCIRPAEVGDVEINGKRGKKGVCLHGALAVGGNKQWSGRPRRLAKHN